VQLLAANDSSFAQVVYISLGIVLFRAQCRGLFVCLAISGGVMLLALLTCGPGWFEKIGSSARCASPRCGENQPGGNIGGKEKAAANLLAGQLDTLSE